MKASTITSALLLTATLTQAQQIDLSQATQIAQRHFAQTAAAATKGRQAPRRSQDIATALSYTGQNAAKRTSYYVFNQSEDGGFVIVSANDAQHPILGYCEHGQFCYDSIPANMRAWIDQYATMPHAAPRRSNSRTERQSIAPLIQTQWDQRAPYNCAIPPLGTNSAATGCVPTAMAQLMKYYNYPAHGTGDFTTQLRFWVEDHWATKSYAVSLDAIQFDWANMRDSYIGHYSEQEARAVGQLMYCAGVCVDPSYGTSQSGSNMRMVPGALSINFGYDKSAYEANRFEYSDEEWEELIYQELAAGQPVIYNGKGGTESHEFICTGYDADEDMFYFNWGWGGAYDGRYAMTRTEDHTGLTPYYHNFNDSQSALVNVMPDRGGDFVCRIMLNGPLIAKCDNVQFETLTVGAEDKDISLTFKPWNLSAIQSDFRFAFAFRHLSTGALSPMVYEYNSSMLLNLRYTVTWSAEFSTKSLEENGEYEIVPFARFADHEEWVPMLMLPGTVNPHIMVTNRQPMQKVDVGFELSSTTLAERTTSDITHNPYYTGAVSYTPSDPAIATVDAEGVIKAIKAGKTTITAKTQATDAFNATTRAFEVMVTPYEPIALPITLDNKKIEVGQTAQIGWPADYTGKLLYEVENPTVAMIDGQGQITALAVGSTSITVKATAADDYAATEQTLQVTVSPVSYNGIMLSELEKPNGGCYTAEGFKISVKITSLVDHTESICYYIDYRNGATGSTYKDGWGALPAGYSNRSSLLVGWSGYERYIDTHPIWTVTFLQEDKKTPIEVDGALSHTFRLCHKLPITLDMEGEWKAVCLPYEVDLPSGLKAYAIEGCLGDNLRLRAVSGKHLEMGTPYILYGTAGTYDFVGPDVPYDETTRSAGLLTGSVDKAGMKLQQGDYVLSQRNGAWGFSRVADAQVGQTVAAYTSVLHLDPASQLYADYDFFYLAATRIGDANGDITFDVGDIVTLRTYLNGGKPAYIDTTAADLNRDGHITNRDAELTRDYLLEK